MTENPDKLDALVTVLSVLVTAYPAIPLSNKSLKLYAARLEDQPEERLRKAILNMIDQCERVPTVAQLKAECARLALEEAEQAKEAAQRQRYASSPGDEAHWAEEKAKFLRSRGVATLAEALEQDILAARERNRARFPHHKPRDKSTLSGLGHVSRSLSGLLETPWVDDTRRPVHGDE